VGIRIYILYTSNKQNTKADLIIKIQLFLLLSSDVNIQKDQSVGVSWNVQKWAINTYKHKDTQHDVFCCTI